MSDDRDMRPARARTRAERCGTAPPRQAPERAARVNRRGGRTLLEAWVAIALVVLVVAVGVVWGVVRAGSSTSGAKGKVVAAAAVATTEIAPTPTPVFARMRTYRVDIHYPAPDGQYVAVGFHQAWNTKATDFVPILKVYPKDKYESTKAALKADPSLRLFEMMARGRGSSEFSAADCAVKPGATIVAPVTGKITLITTYKLAGVGTDYRLEIAADGASPVRVVMIHIQDIIVKEGERVEGGVTPLATVRHLPIDNQVNRYLPVAADHTHIQINAVGYKINESS